MKRTGRSGIEYEPAPTATLLDGNEQEADAASLAAAYALLRLYTSKSYLAEASLLLGRIAAAFMHWPGAGERLGPTTYREWREALREQSAAFQRGLSLLDAGDRAAAYAAVAAAVRDGLEPTDLRDERHFSLQLSAEQLGGEAAALAARLGPMAARIDTTLNARWAFQTLLTGTSSADEECAVQAPHAGPVSSGRKIPITGIWAPTTIRHGCPNFLIEGRPAPPLTRACARYDYKAWAGDGSLPPAPRTLYEYAEEPAVWRLVWRDAR